MLCLFGAFLALLCARTPRWVYPALRRLIDDIYIHTLGRQAPDNQEIENVHKEGVQNQKEMAGRLSFASRCVRACVVELVISSVAISSLAFGIMTCNGR